MALDDRADPNAVAQQQVLGFVQQLQRRCRLVAAAHAALRVFAIAGLPGFAVLALWPAGWIYLLPPLLLLLLAAAGLAAAKVATLQLPPLRLAAATAAVAGGNADSTVDLQWLGDALPTFCELRQAAVPPPLMPWLLRQLAKELPVVPQAAFQPARHLLSRRLQLAAAVAVLLALAFLLSLFWQPPWSGLLGGKPEPPPPPPPPPVAATGPGSGETVPSGAARSDGASPKTVEPPAGRQPVPLPEPEPDREPEPMGPPPPPEPPAPLLDLPGSQHFVVPDHIGDGPVRRHRMHVAEVPDGEGGAVPPPPGSAAAAATSEPPPLREQFERAAEAAAAARHVPPAERAMVQRYFQRLQESAR